MPHIHYAFSGEKSSRSGKKAGKKTQDKKKTVRAGRARTVESNSQSNRNPLKKNPKNGKLLS
jgi:hypothetical protein